MKPLLLIMLSLLTGSALTAQVGTAADFANFARYAEANDQLRGKENHVVLLGNSITDTWAKQDPEFFKENGLIGRGISGQTSAQLLLRFHADVVALQPQSVVIHIGTNDIAENTGPYVEDQTFNNIVAMVDIAKANGIETYVASVVPSNKFSWRPEVGDRSGLIVQLNTRLEAMARERGIRYIDYHAALRNKDNSMDPEIAPDSVHPSPKGYQIMGAILLNALK